MIFLGHPPAGPACGALRNELRYHRFTVVEILKEGAPMPIHRFHNPPTIGKPTGYTHVVEATSPARIIYIAGQLGLDVNNKIVGAPGDFRAQAEQTFVNLKNALASGSEPFRIRTAEVEVPSLWVFQLIVPMANAWEGRIHDHPLRRSVGI